MQLFIDGRWKAGADGRVRDVIDPATGELVRQVAEGDVGDAREAVAAARRAFDSGDWPTRTPAERGRLLWRLADLIEADREQLAELETRDTGKTLKESRLDIDDVAAVFRYYAGLADKSFGYLVPTAEPAQRRSVVRREPIGVCAQISPWNYPLLQASWKLAPALVAGNSVVVKPSELTPLTTIRCFELLEDVGLPPGVANLVLGAGPTVGATLSSDPGIDMVSFTGGIETGRLVMRAAADTVKRIALELGGKNPNIVFADAPFEAAVDHALLAVFLHAGQVCSAGSRLLVEDPIHDLFVESLLERTARIKVGNGFDPSVEMGPLISPQHRTKVEAHVERALSEGAQLACGGGRPTAPELADGFFYEPTVLIGCEPGMAILRDEVFGPVLTVERFTGWQEAVERANDTDYGLAGGLWTTDLAKAERVAASLQLGTVWVNDFHPYFPQAPWGGFKRSGIGRELGPEGLAEYQETKHIHTNLAPRPTDWFGAASDAS